MSSTIDVLPATEDDLPTLARIAIIAMDVDLLHRVMFPSNNPSNTTFMESFVLDQIKSAVKKSETRIFKAVSKMTGEIAGYGFLSYINPPKEDQLEKMPLPLPQSFPDGVNGEFIKKVGGFTRGLNQKYLSGKRHVWWNHLMVLPDYQKQGVGKALLQYGFYNLGADEVPIWIHTQERGRGMYLKFEFEDVGYLDIDLAEYMGPHKGFGLHRNYCMIRWPGGISASSKT